VARLSGCLDALGTTQRRVLVLRAGVGPGRPQTRRAVAERLDTTVRHVARTERRGLRELRSSARAGRCGAPGTSTVSAGPLDGGGSGANPALAADTSPVEGGDGDGAAQPGGSGVKDEFRTSKPPDELDTVILPGEGGGPPTLPILAAAFLAGFLAVWTFDRYRHQGGHTA
jgi:hypothetical protein